MDKLQDNLLVVDDEEFNRHILHKCLSDAGYKVTLAADGEEAWTLLDGGKHNFTAILLDRRMPKLDGMGLLLRTKADSRFAHLPIIFQTGVASPSDIADGMKAGAFYYLTKPINKEVMLAVVQSAVDQHFMATASGHKIIEERRSSFGLLRRIEFQYRTLSEARMLASTLAEFYPAPQRCLLGLTELLINAVEHGNLGISYQEKSALLRKTRWEEEIELRLALPENSHKFANVLLERSPHQIRTTITDCGTGFDWIKYLEMSPERAFDPNGRGIAMSRMNSFDLLEYLGNGNQVATTVNLLP
ncbi:MAG: response regulator [Gallionellaceae bacterium]